MSDAGLSREEFEKWKKSLPKCVGDAGSCDGDLVGEEHGPHCPMFGKQFAIHWDAFEAGYAAASSLIKQAEPPSHCPVLDRSLKSSCTFSRDHEGPHSFALAESSSQASTQPKCNCGAGDDAYLACHADVCALKKWAAPRYEISQATKEAQASTQPPKSGKGWIDCHTSPPQADLDANRMREPEGERIRAELVDWMTRNKIVSVLLDTENHNVCIDIAKLPPEIKPVLTHWGSIFVENPGGGYTPPPPRTESISQATKEEWARRIAEDEMIGDNITKEGAYQTALDILNS